MLFTQYDCPQTTCKEKFYTEFNFIAYVISGRRIFHKDGERWDMHEGVCAFVKQGTHVAERIADDPWCVMVFFIPDNFLKQLVEENRRKLPMLPLSAKAREHVLELDVSEISRSFFQSMLPYFGQNPPPPENLIELKFKELVLSLMTNTNNEHLLAYLNALADDHRHSIEEVMQNNYRFNLSLTDYANLANKSIPTFKRDFKKLFNESPARWVMKRRLELATDLLKNSSLRVGEIAFECGFENQTHFNRVFKENIGSSPLKFRAGFRPEPATRTLSDRRQVPT
jgi:AraC-like DNA-binding protein